jgi:hypothetical protein
MVDELTARTAANGPIMLGPIKSPIKTKEDGLEAQVITPVEELYDEAFMPMLLGIAPTQLAIRLTRALAD